MDSAATAPATMLKAYVQNVCVLPAGARERHLQVGGILGGLGLLALFLFATTSLSALSRILLGILVFGTGLGFCVVVHVAIALVGGLHALFGWHDHKSERLGVLAKRLVTADGRPAYDVVMLQEFYGAWYNDSNRANFIAVMRRNGYSNCARPSRFPVLPSLWANSGLAVFSPHPITEVENVPFSAQTIYDRFAVNRGVFACDVLVPGQHPPLRVATTHFGPSLAVLQMASFLPKRVKDLLDVHPRQVKELCQVMDTPSHVRKALLLAGDFNAILGSVTEKDMCERLSASKISHLTEELFSGPCPPITANPPGELFLSCGGRLPHTLDYAFGRLLRAGPCKVLPQLVTEKKLPFEYISDHVGLHIEFSFIKSSN
eukprot:INCI12783.4.p1 GENE.INCI12783.4~~INCI12783.4.p1  ORF type:complete len:374 (+),score=47.53 INCI12783.4:284-1405(+)